MLKRLEGMLGSCEVLRAVPAHLPLPSMNLQLKGLALFHSALSGPAFPSQWLQPGAMARLELLILTQSPQLSGSLPENLSWSNLRIL